MDSHIMAASENPDSCDFPVNSNCLTEVLTEIGENIRKMLKLIEDNNDLSSKQSSKEFGCIYQSFAERYGELSRELMNLAPLDVQMSGSDNNGSSPATPRGTSSDVSPNLDSDSSSSEFESESETFYTSLKHHLGADENERENSADEQSAMKMVKQVSYEELTERVAKYEEDARIANIKLKESEDEIEKLKSEIQKSESAMELAENMHAKLESETRQVVELQSRVLDLEYKLSGSSLRIESLEKELEANRQCLVASEDEILQVRERLTECRNDFLAEKERISALLNSRIKQLESDCEMLEEQIACIDSEKIEIKALWEAEVIALKEDIATRAKDTEALNRDMDKLKLSFDMVRSEKDNLRAELRSKEIEIEQMGKNLTQLQIKQSEVISESGIAKNAAEELKNRVEQLEEEVKQREEGKREAIRQLCFSLDHYRSGYRQLVRSLSSNKNKKRQAVVVA